jgi:hypothetical protein
MSKTFQRWPWATVPLVAGLVLATGSCTGSGARESPPAAGSTVASPTAAPATQAPSATTDARVGAVAGRLGTGKRQQVVQETTAVTDHYLDGAFGGTYPRTDFTAAFADFRAATRRSAERELSLLTNVDVGARVTSVAETERRVRVDVLAPAGQPRAATVRFVLDLDTAGEVAQSMRVAGSLLLTKEKGTWKVFGYDVRPEVRP